MERVQRMTYPAGAVLGGRALHPSAFFAGVRAGVPIGLGYFAVSFSLGIAARSAGLTAFQALLASALELASAGEYAAFTLIAAGASLWEMALMTLITNARYLLMSCALSQRLSPDTPLSHRLLTGWFITDELFAVSSAQPGRLDPRYLWGAAAVAAPCWSVGTALGVLAGNLLPLRAVSALSVALYGMFLAVIVPAGRKSRVLAALVLVCFAASWAAAVLPLLSALSAGSRTILLTLVIAGGAALLFPVKEEADHA